MTRALLLLGAACVVLACSVGQGSGSAHGEVSIPDCRRHDLDFDLRPDFFVGDFVEDPRTVDGYQRNILEMRMQHGSYGEGASDGISLLVRDVDSISSMLGTALVVGVDENVSMTLYLGASCPSGAPRGNFFTLPVYLTAVHGTITFDAIYAPNTAPDALRIAAHFEDVRFEDAEQPTTRFGQMNGELAFFFQRGRPAQHFP